MKTWHWMVILPVVAIAFKALTFAVAAGLDGRTVYHVHTWAPYGQTSTHTTPYLARLLAVIRGRASTLDYACPHSARPIEKEWIVWPQ